MGSVNDIHNFDDQFRYQLEKLEEAGIDDRDAQAIREFIRYQDTQRGLATSTNVDNCSGLRLRPERRPDGAVVEALGLQAGEEERELVEDADEVVGEHELSEQFPNGNHDEPDDFRQAPGVMDTGPDDKALFLVRADELHLQ